MPADKEKVLLPVNEVEHLNRTATIDYKYELVRKGIHIFSLSIPIVYFFVSKELALTLLLPVAAVFITIDIARYYIPQVSNWFYRWFGWLLRRHESDSVRKRLNGASTVLISALLCVFLLPKIIAINAFTILIISDTTSALIGRRLGRRRFMAKSLEGSLAFFISAVIVVLVAPKIARLPMEYIIGVAAAVIGTIVEALPLKIDDNLTIPISVGLSLWGLYILLLPELNLAPLI